MAKFHKIPLTKPFFPRSALAGDSLELWIGRQEQIDRVVRGLLSSTDTHYLITGYPGVGKSSFVSRAISEWRKLSAEQGVNRVLIFNLHFAYPQSPEEVVKRLIGKVYFGSLDGQFAPAKKLAERLQLNYIQAHAKSLKETQAESATHESGTEATLSLPKSLTILGGRVGALSKESKGVSRSLEVQKEYNLSMATSDLESILHLLTQATSYEAGLFERIKQRLFRSKRVLSNSRTLFIFDQIDDLDFVHELSGFLNMPNASFVVLGGIKLQQQISDSREQGLQVLDNFEEVYLGCHWNKADEMAASLIDASNLGSRMYADYADYLNFCSQGLPRRLFAAMDRHTTRDGNEFYLGLSSSEQKRIRLCAELHRLLWKHRKEILGSYIDSVQHPLRDKALRGAYHLTDRIFRVAKFSFQDANTVATEISAAIMHRSRERVLRNLLNVFERQGLLVKEGSNYGLSASVLNRVKQIPDWLKDGYVDAADLLNEVNTIEARDANSAVSLDLSPKQKRYGPREEWRPDTGEGADWDLPPREEEAITRAVTIASDGSSGSQEIALRSRGLEGEILGGRYVISRLLGTGGMSKVYLAHDSKLSERSVAIKVITEEALDHAFTRAKFRQEIEALARMNHPGIVGILDYGQLPNGAPFIVMEYVEGVTLRSLLRPEGIELERLLNIIKQLTQALEAFHQHGIIHRDLKPENIMIQRSGDDLEQIRIIDFGIAKVRASLVAPTTATGLAFGTTMYMSPEQLRAEVITPASDIYTLGLITYEMVTGRRPFNPETAYQLLEMQRDGVRVLPKDLRPALTERAQRVILKALAFNPHERYQRAKDFGNDLKKALT